VNKNTKEKFILAILADITEKVILQKELAAEHDLLTAFLKHCTDLVYFKDLQSRFIKVGNVFAEQHNLTPEMMVGKTDFDLWGPEHAVQAYNDEQEIIRTGKAIIGKEEKEDWQDGRIT
jgi:PAS domain-containing protein